jgi:hypothetical protein
MSRPQILLCPRTFSWNIWKELGVTNGEVNDVAYQTKYE